MYNYGDTDSVHGVYNLIVHIIIELSVVFLFQNAVMTIDISHIYHNNEFNDSLLGPLISHAAYQVSTKGRSSLMNHAAHITPHAMALTQFYRHSEYSSSCTFLFLESYML